MWGEDEGPVCGLVRVTNLTPGREWRGVTTLRMDSIADVVRQLADETHDENILRGPILKKLIGSLPKWIKYPDVDRVPWLNKAARQMWPHLDKAISTTVINALEPVLNSLVNKSKRTTTLKFSKFTLGIEPPVLASVKVGLCKLNLYA
jgi:hypothetical protein